MIGERVAHHERRVTSSTTQVHESSFGQDKNSLSALELPSSDHILDDLFLDPGNFGKSGHIDFIIEMSNIADNGVVLHLFHVRSHENILITSGSDKDIDFSNDLFLGHDSETFHTGLQSANGVAFSHIDHRVLSSHGGSAAFTHISVAEDKSFLASQHDVGSSVKSIRE